MLMVVTPTAEETETLRKKYAKLHTFVYCATYKSFIPFAEKYQPTVVLVIVHEVTSALISKIARVREILPEVAVITLSNSDVSALSPDLEYSLQVHKQTLRFQAHYFEYESPYISTVEMGALIISGLLLAPFSARVLLYGRAVNYTPEEVFLLRYLAKKHPTRISTEELGRLCFGYGKKAPRSTVAARISRINRLAKQHIFTPIITYRHGEGYGIDF